MYYRSVGYSDSKVLLKNGGEVDRLKVSCSFCDDTTCGLSCKAFLSHQSYCGVNFNSDF